MTNHFESVKNYYSYKDFAVFTEVLVAQGRTTGEDQSEDMIEYTKLNLQRMKRWEKTFFVEEAVAAQARIVKPQMWWIITEPWCGDSAQIVTQLSKIAASSNGNIDFRIILRDENINIIDQYLTNNSRSVPILVALDKAGNELFVWGPRPAPAQQIVRDWKTNPGDKTYEDLKREIHLWYAKDKGMSVQQEILKELKGVETLNIA